MPQVGEKEFSLHAAQGARGTAQGALSAAESLRPTTSSPPPKAVRPDWGPLSHTAQPVPPFFLPIVHSLFSSRTCGSASSAPRRVSLPQGCCCLLCSPPSERSICLHIWRKHTNKPEPHITQHSRDEGPLGAGAPSPWRASPGPARRAPQPPGAPGPARFLLCGAAEPSPRPPAPRRQPTPSASRRPHPAGPLPARGESGPGRPPSPRSLLSPTFRPPPAPFPRRWGVGRGYRGPPAASTRPFGRGAPSPRPGPYAQSRGRGGSCQQTLPPSADQGGAEPGLPLEAVHGGHRERSGGRGGPSGAHHRAPPARASPLPRTPEGWEPD